MADNKSNKVLFRILGALAVLLIGGFAYSKYIEMRMAGASGGDAFLFMIMVFIGILAIVGIAGCFVYYYMIPEGNKIHRGFKKLKKKTPRPNIEEDVELKKPDFENEIKRQENELIRQREELFSLLFSYADTTFRKILSPSQIESLNTNIRKFTDGDEGIEAVETARSEFATPVDLYHFAWNIAIRLIANDKSRKFRISTAFFIKTMFPVTLSDHAITTISNKLTTTDGKYSLRLIKPEEELRPHIFPGTEKLAIKND
ncbi:MAG TPA: hypothetical protein DD424_09310 [Porphyromonadaceae bacterium]|nr:hypothetical protein [Porphyromonadaceae bacterium]